MARFFRWIGILILAAVAIFVLTALAARMSDGPIGLFAGGPLDSGERMDEGLSDWSAFRGVNAEGPGDVFVDDLVDAPGGAR